MWVHALYISSSRNKVAGKESRKLRDDLEWSLNKIFFEKIVGNFGPVTIDLFASHVSCKVNRYYSYNLEPEAIEIDAFSYCWSNETFYAFPLFAIISNVLSKIEAEMANSYCSQNLTHPCSFHAGERQRQPYQTSP